MAPRLPGPGENRVLRFRIERLVKSGSVLMIVVASAFTVACSSTASQPSTHVALSWPVTLTSPLPGSYPVTRDLSGHGHQTKAGTEAVTVVHDPVRGDQVSITTQFGDERTQTELVYIEHRGLFLSSVTSRTMHCDLNAYALAIPSTLSLGESWDVSYPCQVQTPSGPQQWILDVAARVEGISVIPLGDIPASVVELLVQSSFTDSRGRLAESIIARDALEPTSGLIVRGDETEAGDLGALATTLQFDKMP
jgi:hypothetical protein